MQKPKHCPEQTINICCSKYKSPLFLCLWSQNNQDFCLKKGLEQTDLKLKILFKSRQFVIEVEGREKLNSYNCGNCQNVDWFMNIFYVISGPIHLKQKLAQAKCLLYWGNLKNVGTGLTFHHEEIFLHSSNKTPVRNIGYNID